MGGSLIVSLDFELFWGMLDRCPLEAYQDHVLGGREAIPELLALFQKYGIHATWAAVGFLFAENLEEARLMVIGRKGFMPVEGTGARLMMGAPITRVPLVRGNEPILRNYCAFWQKKNGNPYVAEFAELLKKQFQDGAQRG